MYNASTKIKRIKLGQPARNFNFQMAFLPGERGTDKGTFPQSPDYYLAETALRRFLRKGCDRNE